jgi:YVTN family beta-propeller protein
MMTPTAQRALDYAFAPSPNPIRVSQSDASSSVDLLVIISDPSLSSPTVSEITIEIPTGEETSRTISTAPNLPPPTTDGSGLWSITTAGSTVTIVPSGSSPAPVNSPIMFTIPNIQVNETVGTVPITVTEFGPPSPKVVDTTSYSLLKQPADFPIRNFYPSASSLYDLDLPVTLYWECTSQGQEYAYGLRIVSIQSSRRTVTPTSRPVPRTLPSASPPLRDCVSGGNCYTCADGANGVLFSPMQETTTFALDVVATNSDGTRSILHTVETTVQVAVPSISQVSKVVASPTGRFVILHWMAFNARSCSVELEGTPIEGATNAPPDTYLTGYPVYLSGAAPNPTLTVVANGIDGEAQAYQNLMPIPTGSPVDFSLDNGPQAVAITPDRRLALVATYQDNGVRVLDLASRQVEPKTLTVGYNPSAIAITPDGATAFVANVADDSVSIVDIRSRTVDATLLPITNPPSLAITPDGSLLLVVSSNKGASGPDAIHNSVSVVDVASRTIESKRLAVGASPASIAITPDGTLALVTNADDNTLSVIDIAQRSAEAKTIPVGSDPIAVAISPDGSQAIVANMLDNTVTIVDIPGRKAIASPATVELPDSVAFTLDGNHVLIGSYQSSGLSVLDLTTLATDTIATSDGTAAIGMSPDGSFALVVSTAGNVVTML